MATAAMSPRKTTSGNQWLVDRIGEDATQTFLIGVPLQVNNVNGFLKKWDGVTVAAGIAGISLEFGANLANAAVAQQQSYGSVPNEPLSFNYSRPYFNDGMTGILVAVQDSIFYGQVGPNQTPIQSDVTKSYGLTFDVDGHCYVDRTKTGANACVQIVGLDYWDTARGVLFVILPASAQKLG